MSFATQPHGCIGGGGVGGSVGEGFVCQVCHASP